MKRLIVILTLMALACGTTTAIPATQPSPKKRVVVPTVSVTVTQSAEAVELCGSANVRGQAGGGGSAKGWVRTGQTVEIVERAKGWVRIGAGEWIIDSVLCEGK